MRLTAPTVAALLAFALARAGALPSPQVEAGRDVSGIQHEAREFVPDFYHDFGDETFDKRAPHEGGGGGNREGHSNGQGKGDKDGGAANWAQNNRDGKWQGGKPSDAPSGNQAQGQGERGWGNKGMSKRDDDSSSGDGGSSSEDTVVLPSDGMYCRCQPTSPDGEDHSKTGMPCVCAVPDPSDDSETQTQVNVVKRASTKGDATTRWNWWDDQGADGVYYYTGNPNIRNIDFKYQSFSTMGGVKKRQEGGGDENASKESAVGRARGGGGGGGEKQKWRANHALSN